MMANGEKVDRNHDKVDIENIRDKVTIENLVDKIISEYKNEPVDLLGFGDEDDEYRYLLFLKDSYVRTISDLIGFFKKARTDSIKVLEIGPFLGIVSVALSELGFNVTATDIKEFISCKNLQTKFQKYKISYFESNLRDHKLPFNDNEYDLVIMCEVLEHLNFNPLPALKEINRILKLNGLLYLSLPNIAQLGNRLKLLGGESIHNPIKDFFNQLDPNDNSIVGLHWREYTMNEIKEMLEKMDFKIIKQKYDSIPSRQTEKFNFKKIIKKLIRHIINFKPIKRIIYSCILDNENDPTLRDTIVNYALKNKICSKQFHFTDATMSK
jgi:2-polyprenyl-3-methyl-5-hydroxy-6-metoxy-1,4-benzoquinol methylase